MDRKVSINQALNRPIIVLMKAMAVIKPIAVLCILAALGTAAPAGATEVFHWVDENGVHHFSQTEPVADTAGVATVEVEDAPPSGYDPEEDIYGVAAQADRMQALRDEMAEKREDRLERERNAARQQPVQYQPYRYSRPMFWNPPYYPSPPVKPQPPVPEPYETRILIPPGSRPD